MGDILKNCRFDFSPEQPHWVIKTKGNIYTGGADISLFNSFEPTKRPSYLCLYMRSAVSSRVCVHTVVTLHELMQMRAMCDEAIAFMTTRKGKHHE